MSKVIKSLIAIMLFMGSAFATFGQSTFDKTANSWTKIIFNYPQFPSPEFSAEADVDFLGTNPDNASTPAIYPNGGWHTVGSLMFPHQITQTKIKVTIRRNGEVYTRYNYIVFGHRDEITLPFGNPLDPGVGTIGGGETLY